MDQEYSHVKLDHVFLPPKTLILAYKSHIYNTVSTLFTIVLLLLYFQTDKGGVEVNKDWNNVIYTVDAAWLAGDNVSECDYPTRNTCLKKFCDAVNRNPVCFLQEYK